MLDILLGLVGFFGALFLFQRKRSAKKPFPPGPKGYPIVGNIDLPVDGLWMLCANEAKKYGDILGFNVLGQPMVILNTAEEAHELLGQTQCNDRPDSVMINLMGMTKNLGTDPYNGLWRLRRKMFHTQMNKNAVRQFSSASEDQTRQFVARLHKHPENWMAEIRLTAAKVILGVTYGVEVESMDDKLVTLPDSTSKNVGQALLGFHLVNYIPILQYLPAWMPGAGSVRLANAWGSTATQTTWNPFKMVKKQMDNGSAHPSFLSRALESKDADEEFVLWLSGSMYLGGSDTTVQTMYSFFLAMTLYPDVQRKAQEELDRVCHDRMPTIADRENLPYINAVISETLRWWTLVPLALPHMTMEDIVYKGYFLPKGTTVMGNSWAIAQNPKMYPEPERFLPERFLPSNKAQLPMDPRRYTFGYGRRICPGLDFADMNLFLEMSSILATTNISNAIGTDGKPIIPDARPVGGPIRMVKPFPCNIKPRSATAEALIKDCELA